jgi:hypothetical protein
VELQSEEPPELRRDEDQRCAGHVTDEHWLGEKVGDHDEAEPRRDEHDRAAYERHGGGQHGGARRVAAGERPDCAPDEEGDRRVGAGDHLP